MSASETLVWIEDFLLKLVTKCKKIAASFDGPIGLSEVGAGRIIGDLKKDADLPFDLFMMDGIKEYIIWFNNQIKPLIRSIVFEGQVKSTLMLNPENQLDVYVDPCDGSLNFARSIYLTMEFPFSTVITLTWARPNPTFADIVGSAIIDLRQNSNNIWVSQLDHEGNKTGFLNQHQLIATDQTAVEIDDRHIFLFEFYYPKNRRLAQLILREQKGNFRNLGSSAIEMALVSSGQVACWVCCSQKLHELGAAWFLMEAAGGWVRDFSGQKLDKLPFTFNSQLPVILAATPQLGEQLLVEIQKYRNAI